MVKLVAFVSWSSEFVDNLVRKSLLKSLPGVDISFYTSPEEVEALAASPPESDLNLLQWSTYDVMLHELTLRASLPPVSFLLSFSPKYGNVDLGRTHHLSQPLAHQEPTHSKQPPPSLRVLSSSYTIRKALIRKHFLHQQTFVNYLTKHPESPLTRAVPKTWSIDIAFADELDELWADELYDLGELIDAGNDGNYDPALARWWILKPGMADRGMGIRLFRSRNELQQIFQSFEDDESSDEDEESGEEVTKNSDEYEDEGSTRVSTSQLRHFVIQVDRTLPHQFSMSPRLTDILHSGILIHSTFTRPGRGRNRRRCRLGETGSGNGEEGTGTYTSGVV